MAGRIGIRRVYEQASSSDGVRVLVDRLWPRGLRRDDTRTGEWLRDIAPSTSLRHWYGHRPDRFDEFRVRYLAELSRPDHRVSVRRLRELSDRRVVTLVTASRDVEHSQAAVLARFLTDRHG